MRYLGLLFVLAVLGFAQNARDEGWSQMLPPGEGRDLILVSCATCHNVKVVVHARKNHEEWTKTIGDMIQRGAPIFPEEIAPITAYLSAKFGPTVPALVNVNTATREEFEKLPALKPQVVSRILEFRVNGGVFKSPEEFRLALEMSKEEFETIRYGLKYSN
jgi:DNA uptake protein ComE-like DNA-binding protein